MDDRGARRGVPPVPVGRLHRPVYETERTGTRHNSHGSHTKSGHLSIHPREARSFTVREVARLQSFKDTFEFPVTRTQAFHQIGNAVLPLVAEALGTAVRKTILEGGG